MVRQLDIRRIRFQLINEDARIESDSSMAMKKTGKAGQSQLRRSFSTCEAEYGRFASPRMAA